jgi:ABC-2 type transport system ATP-binding protein
MGKTVFLSSHLLYEIQLVCNRVAILSKGNLLRQSTVQELLQGEAQIVVRMNTQAEDEQAFTHLQRLSRQAVSWLHDVKHGSDPQGNQVLFIQSPDARSFEITELLARENLYVAEIYQHRENLEDLFLQLTETPQPSVANALAESGVNLSLNK